MSGLDTSQPIIDEASLHADDYHVHSRGEPDAGASGDEKGDDTKNDEKGDDTKNVVAVPDA